MRRNSLGGKDFFPFKSRQARSKETKSVTRHLRDPLLESETLLPVSIKRVIESSEEIGEANRQTQPSLEVKKQIDQLSVEPLRKKFEDIIDVPSTAVYSEKERNVTAPQTQRTTQSNLYNIQDQSTFDILRANLN